MRELATAEAIARETGDCYQFAAGVVFEVTGRDFRGLFKYRTERRRIKEHGLLPLALSVLGDPCQPSDCDDGDPVIVVAGREMFGVKFQDSVVVRTRKFVRQLPLDSAVHGWRL